MNKIVLSFLYLCNVLGTLLMCSSVIAMSLNNSQGESLLLFSGIELVFFVVTLVYVIIYSKKIKNNN